MQSLLSSRLQQLYFSGITGTVGMMRQAISKSDTECIERQYLVCRTCDSVENKEVLRDEGH